MYKMLISMILVTDIVLAHKSNRKRDTSSLQKQIIAKYIEHLEGVQLDDPAFVKILGVISDKTKETEQCGLMENSTCQFFISKTSATSSRLKSRAVVDTLQDILRGFVSKLVSQHFPRVGSMVKEVFNNNASNISFNDKFQTSSDILVLKTLAKVNQGIEGIKKYKIPMATICSIILAFLLVLFIAKSTSACEKFKETRAQRKAAKLDRYFAMRMRPIQEV